MNGENEKLKFVKEKIIAKIQTLGESLNVKRAGVIDTRKEMWREARIVLRDFDDIADLSVFAEEVARHERQYVEASEEIKKLGKILEEPYFARIDFTEDSCDEVEEIYIGRHSIFDDASQVFFVYDWRAPISSLYYDYGTGAASFTVPNTGAVIAGNISLKRQYQIEKGELVYLFDNDMAIEDDILRLELSKASEANIKTIINTIQTDQNRAIRAEAGDILVYGPAGSGKTSVGLHRLAYLLYRHRNHLTSAKVRIFSPSAVFSSYIAGIIPELGEEDVLTLDFSALIETMGKKSLNHRGFYGPYQLIEHLTVSSDDERSKWLKIKLSAAFLDGLEQFVFSYAPVFDDVYFNTDKICDGARLKTLYADRTAYGTLASKTERVLSYVNQCYTEYFNANKRKITEMFNKIHDENFSDGAIRSKYEEEKNIAYADIRGRSYPKAQKILEKFLRAKSKGYGVSFASAREALRSERLFFEDALILFYIDLLTGCAAGEKTVKHILIDEAQDFSGLHHRVLRRLYPESRFTVLADVNQAICPEININDTESLTSLYPKAEIIPLTKSYRSTYEIMRFAAGFLPENKEQDAYLRHGEEPEMIKSKNPAESVLNILNGLSSDYNTVGILLPTIAEAKDFYGAFEKIYPKENKLHFINAESNDFSRGVMVMAAPFAKGLEFDIVICPRFKKPENLKESKLLYLICTRALHRLYLILIDN